MDFRLKLEHPELSKSESVLTHLLIQIETPPVADSPDRRPLVVGLAIDKSKSMYGDKMRSVIEAASSLVNWLTRHDQLTIVAYDTNVEIVQPLIPLTDKFSITRKLEDLKVGSSTNLSGGWLQALRTVESAEAENAFRRVILLTDGIANTGIVNGDELQQIARDHYSRNISTTTIGFGRDFSEQLLKDVATAGGGNFYFIEGPEQSQEVFFKEFGDIAALFGQGLEIKLNFAPGVTVKEYLSDVPHNLEDSGLVLRPGDLRSDDLKNITMVLEIDGSRAYERDYLVKGELSFYNLQKQSSMETHSATAQASFSDTGSETFDPVVRLESLLAASSRVMMEASRVAGEKDLAAARDIIHQMVKRLQASREIDSKTIDRMISRLGDMEHNLEENLIVARKQMMAQASDTHSFRISRVETGVHNRILETELQGQLDLYRCPEIKATIRRNLENGYRFIIFDLTELTYVDSSGIGTLIQISNWLKNRGGVMILANVQGSVEKIFQISKLDEFFVFKDSVSAARLFLQEIIDSIESDS